jgi:hypothetical protein
MFSSSNALLNPSYPVLAKKPKASTLTVKSKRFNAMIPSFRSYFEFHAHKPTKPLISKILPNYSINDYLPNDSHSNKTLPSVSIGNSYAYNSRAQYGPETTRLLQDSVDSIPDIEIPLVYCKRHFIVNKPQRCFNDTGIQTSIEDIDGGILRAGILKQDFDATFKPKINELDNLLVTSQFGDRKHKISNETDMSNINLVTESMSTDNLGKQPPKLDSFISELKNSLLNEESLEDSKSEQDELMEKRQVKCEVYNKIYSGPIQSFRTLNVAEPRSSGFHFGNDGRQVMQSMAETASFRGSTRNSCSNGEGKTERYSQRTELNKPHHLTQFSAIEEETSEFSKLETSKASINYGRLGSEAETLQLLSKVKEDSADYAPHTSFESIPLTDKTTHSINNPIKYKTEDIKNTSHLDHSFSIGMSIKTIPELLYSIDNEENIDSYL